MNYTEDEIKFLIENYSQYGPSFCAKKIGKNVAAVTAKAKRLGLKKIGTQKHPSLQKVDPRLFWEINRSDVAYFLGFMWADGHIIQYTSNVLHSSVRLEIQSADFYDLQELFYGIGEWCLQIRKRNESWKETAILSTNSIDIYSFLEQNDFRVKSTVSPSKILSKIPENLHKDFWRGFFDGDGSLSFKECSRWKSLQLAGSFNQDWSDLQSLLDKLGVKYNVYKKSKVNCSSTVQIQNTEGISSFLNYLLGSSHGLSRKTEKIQKFFEKWPEFSEKIPF